jgi:hypothetical protein
VTDILRFDQPHDLSARFVRPDSGVSDFDNNERVLDVGTANVLDFEAGAEAAAALATGSASALAALYTGSDAVGFVRAFGRRAFRRPLSEEEETKYQSVFALGQKLYGASFANGAALVIRAMLESPHFLYRTELGPAGDPLTSYELASKLSFWLLGTTPADSLLDAAAAGALTSLDGLEAAARDMLEDPRTLLSMRDFHGQLLHLDQLQSVAKVGVPEYHESIKAELVNASYAFVDRIFGQNLGLRELLTSHQAYAGPELASLYGVDAPASALELRDVGPSRSGYFMQIPFLLRWGLNDQSDPIHRGAGLELTVLCAPVGVPAAILPPLPPLTPGQTNRERITQFTGQCGAACHARFNPLGFALENFDGLGQEREIDNGGPVDTTGSYPFADGTQAFADGNELMKIMAGSTQAHTCYAKRITGYALGRDMVETDRPLLESLAEVSLSDSLKETMVALVRDPAFRTRKAGLP